MISYSFLEESESFSGMSDWMIPALEEHYPQFPPDELPARDSCSAAASANLWTPEAVFAFPPATPQLVLCLSHNQLGSPFHTIIMIPQGKACFWSQQRITTLAVPPSTEERGNDKLIQLLEFTVNHGECWSAAEKLRDRWENNSLCVCPVQEGGNPNSF